MGEVYVNWTANANKTYEIEVVNSVTSSTQLVFPVLASQSDPGPLKQHSLESKQKQSALAAESSLESSVYMHVYVSACMHDKLYRDQVYSSTAYYTQSKMHATINIIFCFALAVNGIEEAWSNSGEDLG